MTLYNANTSGKGRPRLRLRTAGLPMQVITPALGEGARMSAQYGSISARALGASALEAQRLGKFAAGQHWSSTASSLNGWKMRGVLAFAPSAALDVYESFERDLRGDSHFNSDKFWILSAKSQSGNLLGWGVGVGIAFAMGATAPVILLSLGAGVVVQSAWGWLGGPDWAAATTVRTLK